MAAVETVMEGCRTYLRDQPRFFSATVARAGLTRTLDLPHRNITGRGLIIAATDGAHTTTGVQHSADFVQNETTFSYVVDEREGLVRVVTLAKADDDAWTMAADGWSFVIEGYYYEWISDVDLKYFANNIIAEHAYHRDSFCIDDVSDLEEDCMALGAACEVFWSLLAEYSRDIDVNTPEGIAVPTTQRYRQVEDLLFSPSGLLAKYRTKANMLGVGLERIEVMTLRRVSRTTNRLVPVYRPREWDDAGRPVRVFPPIDQQGPSTPPPSFLPAASVTSYFDVGEAYPNP